MKIKKLFITCIFVLFMTAPGVSGDEAALVIKGKTPSEITSASDRELINRLEEILSMDIKSMSKSEKKALRKEVRAIKKKLNHVNHVNDGGLYISFGGLIIVLLLLILLV